MGARNRVTLSRAASASLSIAAKPPAQPQALIDSVAAGGGLHFYRQYQACCINRTPGRLRAYNNDKRARGLGGC
jgi:hypothetical protein